MNRSRDIGLVLDEWLSDGPHAVPDGLIDGLRGRIRQQPQRPAWRLAWRPNQVNTFSRAVAGLAAVLAVGLVGFNLLSNPPTGDPSASRQPSAEPSLELSASPRVTSSPPPLGSTGRVVFEHFWPLGETPATQLDYLLPDLRGQPLLPDFEWEQRNPAWSPDGSRLTFSGWDASADVVRELIWETDAEGSEPTLISTPCDPPTCLEEKGPSYSADGRQMVFIRLSGPAGEPPVSTVLAIRVLDSGVVREIDPTRREIVDGEGLRTDYEHPRWSPDGSTIAMHVLVRDQSDLVIDTGVFLVDADGANLRRLSPEELEAGEPEWSPDGSRVLFTTRPIHDWPCCNFAENHIYTIAVDGSDLRRLDTEAWAASPTWADDGSRILFIQGRDQGGISIQDIKTMDADGSNVRLVAHFSDCCRWYPAQQPTP
jgi:Tol biopolymer transport system component